MKRVLTTLVLSVICVFSLAQEKIKGSVKDTKEQPVAGATVLIPGTYFGTYSDLNGEFTLRSSEQPFQIEVSCIGFEKQIVTVNPTDKEISIILNDKTLLIDEFVVLATRVDKQDPMAFTDLSKEQIRENNLGVDLPFLLDQTPSVVVTSDAGAGIGYTGIRIRGSDPTRTNVTINGIPLNDAESQGVFWVNMPDLASSTESIQIQRGVGSSTNGPGAFGATVNIQTNFSSDRPYGELSNSIGSFNTRKHTLKAGTGIMENGLSFDLRLSSIASDGYIDRAFSDLKSFYASSTYSGKKTRLRFNIISGKERTYQAWAGIPKDSLATNRTFNPYTYDNETDNYWQTHYQFFVDRSLSNFWTANIALYYTRGYGYYEQYREKDAFSDYGLNDLIIGGDTISESDFIRQRWLDNDLLGTVFSFRYDNRKNIEWTTGGGYSNYNGRHFGEVIWAEYALDAPIGTKYYQDTAVKDDANLYSRITYRISKFDLFADVQFRFVNYSFVGPDFTGNELPQSVNFNFFNPKAGMTYRLNSSDRLYASFALANKEPNRDDFTESSPWTRPVHEQLTDIEAGLDVVRKKWLVGFNFYFMDYTNQLVLTGKINDVGAYTRVNIPDSYRAGIEITTGLNPIRNLFWNANLTLSRNKINEFTEYIDNWDTWAQDSVIHSNVDISFSPSLIAGSELKYEFSLFSRSTKLEKSMSAIAFVTKYVGDQFYDNTSSEERKLNGYLVNDLRYSLLISGKKNIQLELIGMVRNLFDELYVNNAWVYRYSLAGSISQLEGMYPQAGRNYLVGINLRF